MSRDARFWRNVSLVALAHLAVLLALARASKDPQKPNVPEIVWMNAGTLEIAAAATPPPPPPALELEATPPEPEKQEEPSVTTVARSEIHLPSPTPIPTPTPTPKPTAAPTTPPKTSPKPTAKPIPKATPRKPVVAATTPKPSPKKEKGADTKEKSAAAKTQLLAKKESVAGKPDSTGDGPGNGNAPASEFAWYRTMLHDRFYKEWQQPKTILATGAKMSTLVKIRIEKDGRVSKFTIFRPSGNVVMDESVAAITQRVTQVDPLPAGLVKGAYYEVQINFELNPER
ncbi:MAG TPA: TonB family protein [Chthoniobacterales bacterium]|nr:TonB family protein [Chthoniobacterales bacterium]